MKDASLGDKVRDRITGFTGIVVARTQWLNGCIRLQIQPEALDKDGKIPDVAHLDVQQCELVKAEPAKLGRTGGDRSAPVRAADTRRE
jgi:hypothetical protein